MDTEQDPRYAGYVQRKQSEGKEPQPYDQWKARQDGLDKARATKAGELEPDTVETPDAVDERALAAEEMVRIAEERMALADAKMAEAEQLEQRHRERLAAQKVEVLQAEVDVEEAARRGDHVNASELGALTHVQADAPARIPARSVDEFGPEEILHFSCPANRNRVEIMQAGQKTVINNQIVVLTHKAIEFTEHHWSADLSDPDARERAAWLLQSKAFRSGEIVLVPNVVLRPAGVRTGPRTSSDRPSKIERERPSGALSVTVPGAG